MLPRLHDKPVVFLPVDRERVVEDCQRLYNLTHQPSANTSAFDKIRHTLFTLLGGNRNVHQALETAEREQRAPRLLLFRYDAIGDYIVTSPFLRYMAEALPGIEIDVVASTRNASMIANDPFVTSVVAIHPGHTPHPSWLRVRQHTKKRPPDIVAALVFTKMTKAAILALFSGKQAFRVTIEHKDRRDTYGKVFDLQVPHLVAKEHYLETMASIGPAVLGSKTVVPEPYVVITSKALNSTTTRLGQQGCRYELPSTRGIVAAKNEQVHKESLPGKRYVVFNISAFSPNRKWDVTNACAVAQHLVKEVDDLVCFVTGGPEETGYITVAVKNAGHPSVVQWKGTMAEYTALLVGSSLVVTPDTAAVHIAAAAGVPVVALFAELIKVAEWFPYNTEYRAILSPNPDTINDIPVQMIAEQAASLLC